MEKEENYTVPEYLYFKLFGSSLTHHISKYFAKKDEIRWSEENFNICIKKKINFLSAKNPKFYQFKKQVSKISSVVSNDKI